MAALGDDAERWREVLAHLAATPTTGPDTAGEELALRIEAEALLSDDPEALAPEPLRAFLSALAQVDWPDEAGRRQVRYGEVCREFVLRGPAARVAAAWLWRYVDGRGLLVRIAQALRRQGGLAESCGQSLQAAIDRAPLTTGGWAAALQMVAEFWDDLPRDDVRLSRQAVAFVTFDGERPARRDRVQAVVALLALPVPASGCLIELRFRHESSDALHVPTCADAGWYTAFSGAGPGAPHGLTAPRSPWSAEPQPEVVLATPTLGRIAASEHLRALL